MVSLGLLVRLEAKPGKEKKLPPSSSKGFRWQIKRRPPNCGSDCAWGPSTFGIFDAFADEAGRQTHLNGPIAKALFAAAPDLLASPPSIEKAEVLGAKLPSAVRNAA